VPAHNEESCLGDLLESLAAQRYPKLRVRVALDRCTDASAAIVQRYAEADPRFQAVVIEECPPEWAGKVNAVHAAVTRDGFLDNLDDAEWLLFTDADTEFHPDLVRASVQFALARGLGFISLLPTLRTHRWFERIVQPVAAAQFLQIYPLRLANRPGERRRPAANGQFMLFRKDAYLTAGTHEAVRKFLLEDLGFARRLHKRGVAMGLIPAGRLFRCNMYDCYTSFREGWKRIYIDSMHWRVDRLRTAMRWQQLIGWTIFFTLLANLATVFQGDVIGGLARIGVLLLAQFVMLLPAYLRQGAGLWAIFTYPFATLLLARILAEAADDLEAERELTWGGRSYKLQPRSGDRQI
ncbi:MAG: glycosyltransferase, partial [Phycisphaerales bacterium JB038]